MTELALLVVVGLPLFALWISAGVEVIRRPGSTASRRLVWIAVLVFLPVVGLGAYIVTRTPPEVSRDGGDADASQAEQIVVLAELRQRGELDDEDFRRQLRSLGVRLAPTG